MKYYKVVKKDMCSYASMDIVSYKINKWTEPTIQGSDLFVFDSLNSVNKCIEKHRWTKYIIFECEVKNPRKTGIFMFTYARKRLYFKEAIKNRKNKKKYSHLVDTPPDGTVFCSAVKLTVKICENNDPYHIYQVNQNVKNDVRSS